MAGAHSGLISETVKVSQSLKSFFEGTLFLFSRADAIATTRRAAGISLGNRQGLLDSSKLVHSQTRRKCCITVLRQNQTVELQKRETMIAQPTTGFEPASSRAWRARPDKANIIFVYVFVT